MNNNKILKNIEKYNSNRILCRCSLFLLQMNFAKLVQPETTEQVVDDRI